MISGYPWEGEQRMERAGGSWDAGNVLLFDVDPDKGVLN